MTDKIAIFLTVLASSCLGIYFYYNENETNPDDSANDPFSSEDITPYIEENDIFTERKTVTKLKKNKKKSTLGTTRKKY